MDGVIAAPNDDLVTRLVWWTGVDEDVEGEDWSGVRREVELFARFRRPLRVRVMGLSAPVEGPMITARGKDETGKCFRELS